MVLSKKTFPKLAILVFATLFILSNSIAYAQIFTDVPDSHWAKDYIEKMNKAGVITGYDDATFRPNDGVTRVQAMIMISRLYGLSSQQIASAKAKHQSFLNELEVESWAQEGLAVALEKGIVPKEVVKNTFYQNGNQQFVQRDELCVYLTKAMGLDGEAKSKSLIYLPFTDKELIDVKVQPYIQVMIDKGVINSQGDANGRFNPKSKVIRAEMAKMLSIAYDYINDNNVTLQPIEEDEEVETTTISGTIAGLIKATDEIYITVEDKKGKKVAYKVNSSSEITMDGKDASMEDIVEGLEIEAEVTDDFRVISLETESVNEDYSGKLKSILLTDPAMITIEYEVDDDDDDTERKAFYVTDDVEITLDDDDDASLRDLNEGDIIEIKVVNNRITEIEAQSKEKTLEGIIKKIDFNPEPVLIIEDEDEDEETHEYPVDEDARIKRNKKSVEITDLMVGDEVEVDIEYNVITKITADIVEGDDEGTIKSILIADRPELTIINEDGEEVTYYIATNADIEVDNEDTDIYGLKLGYYVEVETESNHIKTIEAEARQLNDRYEGEIEYINEDAEIIVLSIESQTGEKQNLTIATTSDTTYLDADGDSSRFRYLDKGDIILVIGNSDGSIFTARSIIILQDRN